MFTAVLRLCGHPAGGPTGVPDQSMARVRSAISLLPARKDSSALSFMAAPRDSDGGGSLATRQNLHVPPSVQPLSTLEARNGSATRRMTSGKGNRTAHFGDAATARG